MIPNTRRFFVAPELLSDTTVIFSDRELVHQLQRVLRLRVGDRILLLDGAGLQAEATISELARERVCALLDERTAACGELPVTIDVYAALIRPERFEWLLQKAVELGAAAVIPLVTAHTAATDAPSAQRMQRWQRILREAAEQSCRGRLPQLRPAELFSTAAATAAATYDLAVVLDQAAARPLTRIAAMVPHARRIAVFSGPEGGLAPAELQQAEQHGMMPATLGQRVLRAETAPLAALALLSQLYDQEQFG
jgi:16S rRNA (uracil1498-N3)-methyltransferase